MGSYTAHYPAAKFYGSYDVKIHLFLDPTRNFIKFGRVAGSIFRLCDVIW